MYQSHWGISRSPFPSGVDTHLFHETDDMREALARLRYLVDQRRRLGLVLGGPGMGKSLLAEVFTSECRHRGCRVAQVDLLGIGPRELYWQLASQLASSPPQPEEDTVRLYRRVADAATENRMQGLASVVVIEGIEQASPDLAVQLLRLVQIDRSTDARWTLILTTAAHHAERLDGQLSEMVDLRIDLTGWTESETVGYVQLALVEAGCERPLFEEGALHRLHELTRGVPRQVNRLADFALLVGSKRGLEQIDAATVESAHEATGAAVMV